MKLVRFGERGKEKPGVVDPEGVIRDVSDRVADWTGATISSDALGWLGEARLHALPAAPAGVRLGCPIAQTSKFIAIGLNYADHAAESGMPAPAEPVVFTKAVSCITGPYDPIMLPRGSEKTDWEVELGIVIGKTASYVEEAEVLSHVAGYCVINDVSERAYQLERGGTWDKGKGCDTFGPVGPWLVTPDEAGDPQSLPMWLDVNGLRMQTGNTRTMIFGVASIVSYLSRFMTLHPGDLIATGTPPGVGMGKKPAPVYLKTGDVVTLGIEGLGAQRQDVIGWRALADR
jgi:2-keto-4-pentenoate hydratase/2-oxohepta-3-ene-1,7-dioic acid hydratase in catechol pathway